MDQAISNIGVLVLIASIVAMVARRAKIPYAVALLLTGAALGAVGLAPHLRLSRDLIYDVFLPPLIFEAALYLDWRKLRRDSPLIGLFATVGVLIAATIAAVGMRVLVGWPVPASICFGALIAATDPVSVIATFKESGVIGRLRLLVESESLFNDATAAILFALALAYVAGDTTTASGIAVSLLRSAGGGAAAGGVVAVGAMLLAGRTSDHIVEVTITTVAAYGAFIAAERIHASGVLASLVAGLIVGNVGTRGPAPAAGRAAITTFWEYAAFVANSLIFLLIGVQVAYERIPEFVLPSILAIVLVLVGRAASIYPLSALFSRSSLRITASHQHLLFWGGLRGALALALAMGLPADLPARDEVVTVTFAVVAFSIIVQGLSISPLLRRLGETTAENVTELGSDRTPVS